MTNVVLAIDTSRSMVRKDATTCEASSATQTFQWLGTPWARSSGGIGPAAAASRPSRRKNR